MACIHSGNGIRYSNEQTVHACNLTGFSNNYPEWKKPGIRNTLCNLFMQNSMRYKLIFVTKSRSGSHEWAGHESIGLVCAHWLSCDVHSMSQMMTVKVLIATCTPSRGSVRCVWIVIWWCYLKNSQRAIKSRWWWAVLSLKKTAVTLQCTQYGQWNRLLKEWETHWRKFTASQELTEFELLRGIAGRNEQRKW